MIDNPVSFRALSLLLLLLAVTATHSNNQQQGCVGHCTHLTCAYAAAITVLCALMLTCYTMFFRGVISDVITKGSGGCWVDISHDVRGYVPLLEMSDKPDVLQHTNTRLVHTTNCMVLLTIIASTIARCDS
jgi:hypothetical protein